MRLLSILALALLCGCPAPVCDEVELEIGTGNRASGFLAVEAGADLPMWSVRHEWNRMVPINLRAHGLEAEQGETFGLRLGLYQGGDLVAGTTRNDAAPEAGQPADFLGLLAQVVTYEYEPLSGRATRVEAELTDRCGDTARQALEVFLWAPEDLCAQEPEPGEVSVGTGDPFEPLEPQQEVDVVALDGGDGLLVSARASNATSPLTASYLLRRIVLRQDGDEVGRVEPSPESPDRWTLEQADFLGVEVPFDGAAPPAGAEVEVEVVLSDVCGRELQAALPLTLR